MAKGKYLVLAESHEILEKFIQVKVSPSQVYQVTDSVGERHTKRMKFFGQHWSRRG
jgi:hypothetical protein